MTVQEIYTGSDGDATRALYTQLAAIGPIGIVALNLFRAAKNSERAKNYRGGLPGKGSYKSMAYDRKEFAVANLCTILTTHAANLSLIWGWQRDGATPGYEWVLYVEIEPGQVSFHAPQRGQGPDFPHVWDGVKGVSHERIILLCEHLLLHAAFPAAPVSPTVSRETADKPQPSACTYCATCCVWWPPQRSCPKCWKYLIEKARPTRREELRPGTVAEWS